MCLRTLRTRWKHWNRAVFVCCPAAPATSQETAETQPVKHIHVFALAFVHGRSRRTDVNESENVNVTECCSSMGCRCWEPREFPVQREVQHEHIDARLTKQAERARFGVPIYQVP